MKAGILTAFMMMMPFAAFATETPPPTANVCGVYLECATYEGVFEKYKDAGITTNIKFEAVGTNGALMTYTLTQAGEEDYVLLLDFVFQADGQFVVTERPDNTLYASGICEGRICTYGMRPWVDSTGNYRGHTGIMRFTDAELEFRMSFGTPNSWDTNLGILTKK